MFLAKEVADYTNCTFFQIMDQPAMDVFSVVMVIQAKTQMEQIK